MKFRFRYQKVLDYKKQIEEEKKQHMAYCASLYNKVLEEIVSLNIAKKESKDSLILPKNINNLAYREYVIQFLDGIKTKLKYLEERKEELLSDLEKSKEIYLEAKKELMVFEHLKNKDYQEFIDAKKKKERQELDFYAQEVFARKQKP